MASLKSSWKDTGKDLGHAFSGLGKTIIKSAKHVVNKADDWAEGDDKNTAEAAAQNEKADGSK